MTEQDCYYSIHDLANTKSEVLKDREKEKVRQCWRTQDTSPTKESCDNT